MNDLLENIDIFVQFRMTNSRQRTRQRLRDVEQQVVIAQSSVSQTSSEHDEIDQEIGRAKSGRIDVDGSQKSWMIDTGK